ncbi:preprotein translocase subunit SecD [Actinophytocola algeriensis]|uniref:Protein translocase subunit SecD n=1 Tax=Actinophytocola algeriensis TaxID=1768010 RepID=A0A7W7Q8D0_9PSEU|nr:preprotein translocase subunit SecD [Actinophytocola algeriensis]MBE1474670.1 preprotein translocase subunit SecD [Actinophytocola algeriensis]
MVLLYGLVFATPNHKLEPKLGIDLQGGTRVTLTARTESGDAPSREALDQARQIIENRVNGIGVSGTEVVLDGNNIIITVPGEEGEQAKDLGQTAQLRFRAVIGQPQPAQVPQQQEQEQPTEPAPGEESTAPSAPATEPSVPPSAGGTTGTPQGRPAPAVAGQPGSTAPSEPSAPSEPPASGAEQPSDEEALADPLSACAKYAADVDTYNKDVSAGKESAVTTASLIQSGRACRQAPQLAGSEDGTVQPDATVQQAAMAALDCSRPDPLVGNDLSDQPLVACDQEATAKYVLGPTFLQGTEISDAGSAVNPEGVGYVVTLDFKSGGSRTWADYTEAHVGQMAAFVLDTQVVSAPEIQGAITGQTQITGGGQGGFSSTEAKSLADVLKYGSLPLSFDSSEAETVSATLGIASLKAGLIAGAIGLLLVFVYCLFYYRMLGLLTILSLALSAVIVFAFLVLLGRWIGFTLDLAGVAGFIVAIGITADSFVIFFERLKDEIREGRTFRSAVPRAWVRARRTILSADMVMFLAAAVLYVLAVGQVRGFAFTLGMSTVLDLIVVFLVTHPLVSLASKSKFLSKPSMSGLGAVQRQANERRAAGRTVAKEV